MTQWLTFLTCKPFNCLTTYIAVIYTTVLIISSLENKYQNNKNLKVDKIETV